jgi:putative transposase
MSFWRLYYHLVWATYKRSALITPEIETHLCAVLRAKARELGVTVYAVNGWVDHVHLLVAIPPKLAVARVVKHLKGASSHQINSLDLSYHFGWQRGYGVLSVGERRRSIAEAYIAGQKEHHVNGTTNAWLEREAGTDVGPPDPEPSNGLLRDEPMSYAGDEFPL